VSEWDDIGPGFLNGVLGKLMVYLPTHSGHSEAKPKCPLRVGSRHDRLDRSTSGVNIANRPYADMCCEQKDLWSTIQPMGTYNTGLALLIVALASILAAGCSTTRGTNTPIEESGFLTDYSLLDKADNHIDGDSGPKPRYRYVNPDADWAAYDKALVDPVLFFASDDIEVPKEVQTLLNYFWAEIREELKQDYELVESSQPGTLRITIALTRAGERNVTMDTISTWIPFARAWAEMQAVSGKPTGVGYAKVELKFTDAETGTLLGASMDKRVGGKTFKDFDSWSDVRAALDYWTKLLVFRLCLVRGDSDCPAPAG
jgi:hypothetical protein